MFVPGWQRVCPAVQSVHAPAWHVPASLPTAHTVPSVLAVTPHTFPLHAPWRHGFVGAGHWATDVHCTQLPELFSQYGVFPPQLAGGSYWPFALQLSTWLPLHTFVPGVQALHTPTALHVPPVHAVPCGFAAYPHVPLLHTAWVQSFPDAGQSDAAAHCTQSPPMQSGDGEAHASPVTHFPSAPHDCG
jgi:hypothetical protein